MEWNITKKKGMKRTQSNGMDRELNIMDWNIMEREYN